MRRLISLSWVSSPVAAIPKRNTLVTTHRSRRISEFELGKGGADLHLAEEQAFHRRPVRSQAGPRVREAHLAEKCAYLIDVRGYAAWTS